MFEKTLVLLTVSALSICVFLVMSMGPSVSITGALICGVLAVTLYKYLQGDFESSSSLVGYYYQFQQYPFGEWHFFSTNAANREEANALARDIFLRLVTERKTVMQVFYPAS